MTNFEELCSKVSIHSVSCTSCALDKSMDGYKVTLTYDGNSIDIPFSLGLGHNGRKPNVLEVIKCLIMESEGVKNTLDFEDWARDYGYDTDSRSAERVYNKCKDQAEELEFLLGSDYDEFVEAYQEYN